MLDRSQGGHRRLAGGLQPPSPAQLARDARAGRVRRAVDGERASCDRCLTGPIGWSWAATPGQQPQGAGLGGARAAPIAASPSPYGLGSATMGAAAQAWASIRAGSYLPAPRPSEWVR